MANTKFLFVSFDGLIADAAWQVVKEGHEARFYIDNVEEREIANGFVPKSTDWRADLGWADIVVFDDVLGHGTMADELRRSGKLVVGGTPYSDRLEDDRAFGQDELKAAGVSIIPQANFESFDDAMAYVVANPNRYVIKPSGEAQNLKRLLFVGEEEDGRDVLQVLEDYKRAWSGRIREFQLQRRVMGVEVATGAFFNGKEFVPPICVNFEHKKLFPGDIGPSTGEMGTAMFWSEPNKVFNATLKKMEPAGGAALRRLHRHQLHREQQRHLPTRIHGALRLPDHQHSAGRVAHPVGRAVLQTRGRLDFSAPDAERVPGRRARRGAPVPVQR